MVEQQQQDNWEEHWSQFGGVLTGSPAKFFRYQFVQNMIQKYGGTKTDQIFDVGAGTGDFLAFLSTQGFQDISGLEYSHKGVEIANSRLPDANVIQFDLMTGAGTKDNSYRSTKFATCIEVLEHVASPVTAMQNTSKILSIDSVMVITVPGGPRTKFDKHIGHRRHFNAREISEVADQAGFEVLEAGSIGFPFFNLYRMIIFLMGNQVQNQATKESFLKRLFSRLFKFLLQFEIPSNFGWQTYAVVRKR